MATGISLTQMTGITGEGVESQTLLLTGEAAQGVYENALNEIMFENVADEPGSVVRQVIFTIMDRDGFISTAVTTVQIVPTNDQAILNFAGGPRVLVYDEQSRLPINLFDPNDAITDSDGDSLEWLSVILTPGIDANDRISADAGITGLVVTVSSTDDGEVFVNISGNANFPAYESVLNSITFVNTFPGISQENRLIQVVTFDGETRSPTYTITITIGGFNDPPMCFFGQVVSVKKENEIMVTPR